MKKSIIPLLAVLFFGCSNDFSDSSIDVLRPEKEDSVERVDKSWVLIFSDEFNIDINLEVYALIVESLILLMVK